MPQNKNILICPLDWGLGHASRCIPLIIKFQNQNNRITVAGSESIINFLKQECPEIDYVLLKDIRIRYSKYNSQILNTIWIALKMSIRIIIEHFQVQKIIKKHNIDYIISDNRYGIWHRKIHSVIITHQLHLKMPKGLTFLEKTTNTLFNFLIRPFSECWIPDFKDLKISLAGELSHRFSIPANSKYIGPLSRFSPSLQKSEPKYKLLALLSGPEPQRTQLEIDIIGQMNLLPYNFKVIRGTQIPLKIKLSNNITYENICNSEQVFNGINESEKIICRSGYSTLMDLLILNKKAILIPTPGQTEQIYLANHLSNNKNFTIVHQSNFSLNNYC